LRDTIRAVPGSVLGHYRLGRLLQARGKYGEALAELQQTTRALPLVGQDPLYEMVALLYANQADFTHAIAALRKQVAINPANADAHRRLGDSYVRQGQAMEALAEFTAALLVDPANVQAFVGLAQLHSGSGNYTQAARAARSAVALDGSLAQAHYLLGTALMRLRQADEAQREIAEYQRLQAAAAEASRRKFERDGLARQISVATAAGDHRAAVPLLHQLIALEPDAPAHQIALGRSLAASGQTADAIQAYRRALELDSSDPNVHRYLGEAYLAAGQADAGRLEAARYREAIDAAKRERALRYGNP
jgi:tetratricopeptide (TPR) repeat protein